jgi:hypothetical protein
MRGLNSYSRVESRFDVLLTGSAGHSDDWKRDRFCGWRGHLLFQLRWVTGLFQSGQCGINGRWILRRTQASSAYANLFDLEAVRECQCLANAANTGPAVHLLDSQREFRQNALHVLFDDSARKRVHKPRNGHEEED